MKPLNDAHAVAVMLTQPPEMPVVRHHGERRLRPHPERRSTSKGIRTTIPAKDGKRAGDLLDRDFTAPAPNRTWVMDFSYVRCWTGWVYVAFILDVFAQKIVAWNAATTKDVDLVTIPLRMATWQRAREGHPVVPGHLIGHSDAGSQHTAIHYTERLELEGLKPSIGSVGDAYDNALMESVIGLYKTECIRTTIFHTEPYRTSADVEYATAGWVDWCGYAGNQVGQIDFHILGSIRYPANPLSQHRPASCRLTRRKEPVGYRRSSLRGSRSALPDCRAAVTQPRAYP